MVKTLIIDDEQPALDRFKKLLLDHPEIAVVGEALDGLTALQLIEEKNPDLVFIDINMPGLTGLEVAKTIGFSGPKFIFITAYDEFALSAFESNTVDYLLKPVSAARLKVAVQKALPFSAKTPESSFDSLLTTLQSQQKNQRLAVKIGSRFHVFNTSDISVATSQNHYTALIIDGREFLSDDSLEAIVKRLDSNFVRIHRSSIINLQFLKELRRDGDRKYMALLDDKCRSEVPVSRERLPALKTILGID